MKKRLLAVILALCISSTNTMGAFAIASEGGVTQQSEAEGESQTEEVDSEGIDESEEPEDEMTPAAVAEGASSGVDGEQGSVDEEENVTSADDGDANSDGSSDNGSADAGDGNAVGSGDNNSGEAGGNEQDSSSENNKEQGDGTSQDGSSTVDGLTETAGGDILTEGQDSESTADAMSGECGAEGGNLTWELSGEADALTLTIDGEGAMADYSEDAGAPWEKYAANIVRISLSDEVTGIGSYAFAGCSNIEEISVSESVAGIGDNAFMGCDSLTKIYYAGTQEAWAEFAQSVVPDGVEVVYGRTSEIVLKEITLDKAEAEISIGEQLQLTVTFEPVDATNKNVTWTSSDEEVAVIDEYGQVTALSPGVADITATTEDGEHSATCTVSVEKVLVDNILLDKNNLELWVGRTVSLSATVLPENATDKNVAWTSSNEEAVTVDENGVVTAVGKGTATVTVSSEDGQNSASCNVAVKEAVVETGACGDNLTWTVTGSGDDLKLTISGTGPMYDYGYNEWWDSEGGYHPTTTSPWQNYNDRITSIVIEDGVTRIGDHAFTFSGKKNYIEIPASVSEIGTYAFMDCNGQINYWGTTDTWRSIEGANSSINPLNIEFGIEELVLGTGRTQYLSIICNHGECNAKDIIWSSSDDEIVSVDSWGRVTAKRTGEAVITASLYGAECELPVNVVLSASEIKLDQNELTLNKGETGSLAATVEPEDASFMDVIWESSDPEVVAVDSEGTLTALRGGTAVVTASSSYWNLKDSCTVTVIAPVTGVTVAEEAVVDLDAEKMLTASVIPEDATNKNVTWTSSDEEVVQIDSDGRTHGISIGTAEVTATTEDGAYTAVCLVRVITPVTAVTLDKEEMTLEVGQSVSVIATVLPEDAVDKSVVWESSDSGVVSVDADGTISALGSGKATITATSLNGTTAKCEVTVSMPLRKITYVMNGGKNNQANPANYREGSIVQLANPTRGGYIFGGWYLDAAFTKKATGIAAEQTGDMTFYAKWTGKIYKIVFNGNTANSGKMSTITYTMGKTAALPANAFVKKEYIFNGWNTRADGKGTKFNNKGTLGAFDAANGSTITLYAQWKIKQYTITYKLNGGTNNKANPASYNFKSANITLAKPTRKGYSFQGWFTDSKCTKAFTGIKKGSTGNKTVYAKWKANKYTIQYVLNKGTAPKGNPAAYYVTTATITLKNPTRKGYTFLGWYKEATFKTKVVSIPKGSVGNLKLYAKWTATKYTIKYNLNGGTNNKANPATYTINSAKITFAKPTRKGYTFVGWYTDSKYKNSITVINKGSVGNKTLYAKWKLNTYKIEYVLNGGKAPAGNPGTFNVNSAFSFKSPQRTGYIFKGWFSDAGYKSKITGIAKGSAGNKKVYAKWEPIKYTIVFSPNVSSMGIDYTGTMPKIQCTYDQTYKLPRNTFKADEYIGLEIYEWNTRADGKGKVIKDMSSVKNLSSQNGATVTLYANWMEPADEIVIDYWLDTISIPRGYTRKIGYDLYPGYSNERVTFVSSNTKVATVSSTGVIKGIANGKATVTAITSSGKKDTITVKVVDNVRTWNPSYNYKNYSYGEPTVAPIKMYYSGNKLIFEVLVVNNRTFYADYFDYITITLTDSNGKKIVSKKFTDIGLNMAPYSTKKMKFVFDSARKADLFEGDYDYDYWYTYSY